MIRTRRHWFLIAGVAVAIGSGAALGQAAITRAIDATLPDARGINLFNQAWHDHAPLEQRQGDPKTRASHPGEDQTRANAPAGDAILHRS